MTGRPARGARVGPRPPRAGATYHLGLRPGDLPECVVVPGDPARAERIARSWEVASAVTENREFRSFRGSLGGVPMGVVSAGIGGPAMAIVVEELARVGVRTILRVGSSAAINRRLKGGDVAISLAAARFEATSRIYAPAGYPAVADPEVFAALVDSARSLRRPYRVGITATVETFHLSQGRRGFRSLPREEGVYSVADLRRLGILNIEMETATLLTVARLYGLRAGAVCAVYLLTPQKAPVPRGEEAAIDVANAAAVRLSGGRALASRRGRSP